MRGLDEYLRLQDETNKEICLILLDLDTVEKIEKELVYLENQHLLDKLADRNCSIANKTRTEFIILQLQIRTKSPYGRLLK